MKKFNAVITVEVSVDEIANQLLAVVSPDFKHKEMLVEAIIGSQHAKGILSYIYNALNGYTSEIDFEVDNVVECKSKEYITRMRPVVQEAVLVSGEKTPEPVLKPEQKHEEIGQARVIEINLYVDTKLKVEYDAVDNNGKPVKRTAWVKHTDCSVIPQ